MASLPTRLDLLPPPTFLAPHMRAPLLKGASNGPAPSPAALTPPMTDAFDRAKVVKDTLKSKVIDEINSWVQEFQAAHPDKSLQVAFKIKALIRSKKHTSPSAAKPAVDSPAQTALAFLERLKKNSLPTASGGAGASKSEEEKPLAEPYIYKTPRWPERFNIAKACPFFEALTDSETLGDFALIQLSATVSSSETLLGSGEWHEIFSLDARMRAVRGGSF